MRRALVLLAISANACGGQLRRTVEAARVTSEESLTAACRDAFPTLGPRYGDLAFRRRLLESMRLDARISARPISREAAPDDPFAPVLLDVELRDLTSWGRPGDWRVLVRRAGILFVPDHPTPGRVLEATARLLLFGPPEAARSLPELARPGPDSADQRRFDQRCTPPFLPGGADVQSATCRLVMVPVGPSSGPDVLVIEQDGRAVGGALCRISIQYAVPLETVGPIWDQINRAFTATASEPLSPAYTLVITDGW